MEALSTKPKPASVIAAYLRSRRIRGLILLLVSLFGLYYIFLATMSPSQGGVVLNGEGEPMDIVQDTSSRSSQDSPFVTLEKRIQRLIDTNTVMVFSKTYCPYSAAAKKLLHSYTNDFQVLEVDLEEKGADIKTILTKISQGHSTFPSIFFRGKSIGGKDDLQALENKGLLKTQLESMGVSMLQ
ncbi:hypothetical protein BGZ98_005962 [Dissophora globulifera]|nr:hypothetical protein BGZ98_005962 [Dissophora globulifera]